MMLKPRSWIYLAVLVIGACSAPAVDPPRPRSLLSPDTDSRAELQAMIDATPAGGTLVLPDGTYDVGPAATGYFGLRLAQPITLRGSGATVLRQRVGTPASYRLIQVDAPGVTIERLELDGNADALTTDTHRHALFIEADGTRVVGVDAHDFQGDGIYLYNGASNVLLDAVSAHDNRRNGITLSGQISHVAIRGVSASANAAQQIDSEPGAPWTVSEVTISDSIVASPADYGVTVSGSSSLYRSHDWRITGCTITGGVNVVWADDVSIVANAITSSTDHPAVKVYRSSDDVTIARNVLTMTGAALASPSAVYALGTGPGNAPDDLTVVGNTIQSAAPSAFGVRAQGVLAATIVGNAISGADVASAGAAGVYVRATDTTTPVREVAIVGNSISGHGARGVSVAGYSVGGVSAQIAALRAVGNAIGGVGPPQTAGMVLDDGLHPVAQADVIGNSYGAGVTSGRL